MVPLGVVRISLRSIKARKNTEVVEITPGGSREREGEREREGGREGEGEERGMILDGEGRGEEGRGGRMASYHILSRMVVLMKLYSFKTR